MFGTMRTWTLSTVFWSSVEDADEAMVALRFAVDSDLDAVGLGSAAADEDGEADAVFLVNLLASNADAPLSDLLRTPSTGAPLLVVVAAAVDVDGAMFLYRK